MLNEQLLQHLALQEREDHDDTDVWCESEIEARKARACYEHGKRFQPHVERLNQRWRSLRSYVVSTSKNPRVVELLCLTIGLSVANIMKASFYRTILETTMATLPISIFIISALALRQLFHRNAVRIDKHCSNTMEQKKRDILLNGLRCRVSNRLGSIGAPPLRLTTETAVDMSEQEMFQHERIVTSFLDSQIDLWHCTQDVCRALRLGTACRLGVVDSRHCESISVERIEATSLTRWLRNRHGNVAPSDSSTDHARKRHSFHVVSMPLLRRRVYTVLNQTLVRLHDFAVTNSIQHDSFLNGGICDRVNSEPAVVTLAMLCSLHVTIAEIVSFILDWLCCQTITMDGQTRAILQSCSAEARSSIEYLYSALASSPTTVSAMDGRNIETKQSARKLTGLRQQTEMLLAAIMSQQEALTIEEPILSSEKPDNDIQWTRDSLQNTFGVLQQMVNELGDQLQSYETSSVCTAESEQIMPTLGLDVPNVNDAKDNELEANYDQSRPHVSESTMEPHVTLIFSGISHSPRQTHRRQRPLCRQERSPMVFHPPNIFDELRERIRQLPPTIERDAVLLDKEIVADTSNCSLVKSSKRDEQEDTHTGMNPTANDGCFLGELLVSLSQLAPCSDAGEVTQWGD